MKKRISENLEQYIYLTQYQTMHIFKDCFRFIQLIHGKLE